MTGNASEAPATLTRKIHTAHEVLEAWVGTQGVPSREHFKLNHRPMVLLERILQAP